MASEITLYNSLLKYIADGTVDLENDTIMLLLVTDDYVPAVTHAALADVLTSPSPEVAEIASPSNGYAQGGKELTGCEVSLVNSPLVSTWFADNVIFQAFTATFRYGVLYKSGEANGITDPLIAFILFDDAPDDVVVEGQDWTVRWNANGILSFTLKAS